MSTTTTTNTDPRYAHLRQPKSELTKQRMSDAKLGRTYSPQHKLNMRVTQLLKWSRYYEVCPVIRILENTNYSEEEKNDILVVIRDRNIEVSEEGRQILNDL